MKIDSAHDEIKWLERRELHQVVAIEAYSFEHPWSEEQFIRCLRQRNCMCQGLVRGDQYVGFMVYELHETRIHLLNLAVHPEHRFERIGQQLIEKLVSKLSRRRRRILLEVRERNLGAQLFFRRVGFRAIAVLRDFYDDLAEDAYLFEYQLGREGLR